MALVLAASLMIMFLSPEAPREKDERSVAMTPRAAAPDPTAPEATLEREDNLEATVGKRAESLEERSDRFGADAPAAMSKKGVESASSAAGLSLTPGEAPANQQASGSLLVVTCEITPNAAAQDTFRQVLARNQISLSDSDGEQGAGTPGRQPRPTARRAVEPLGNNRPADEGLEVVYVEATPAQLESTLAQISAQRNEFLSVEVGAADARSVQNRWQEQYNRGRGGLTQQRFLQQAPAPPLPAAKPPVTANSVDESRLGQAANQAGQAANQAGQPAGRARAYFMPSEGSNNQRAAGGPGAVELRQQVSRGETAASRPEQAEKRDKAQATGEQRTLSLQESGTLRALFVLRVAEESAPAQPGPAKKE